MINVAAPVSGGLATSMKNMNPIRLSDKFTEIRNYFSPKIIGEVNDVFVKLARIKGEDIPWHNHAQEDELFYIVEGELLFEVEGEEPFTMEAGELFIVPKGINHRVSSVSDCLVMLVEPKATRHTGDVESPITKTIEEQR